jgi:ABC-2 type transport system ATP-binding protein
MTHAVTATHLSKRFGTVSAVDGVDLAVTAGEVFGLVGPNGAGKTTLLQLLAALLDPTSGNAAVLGYDVRRDAEALRQHLGYVSQAFTLYGTLSVEENLDFFAAIYGVAAAVRERRKADLLAWSRLAPFRQRRAARLSGGMQKKLHLCCTLIHEPEVLLLDEPTTGVDPVSRQELWEILYDLVGRGLTLVVATPYMDEAERCHRVALMHQGSLLRCDRPEALKRDVDRTAWELRVPEPERALAMLDRAGLPLHYHRIGDHLRLVAPRSDEVPATLRRVFAANTEVRLRPVPLSMEDVFTSLVTSVAPGAGRIRRPVSGPPRQGTNGHEATAVRLHGLTRRFGDFVAVDQVSLEVSRGEIFGFLGPNGSGKTTTIKMLCGLLAPSAGRAEVLGDEVTHRVRRLKSRIGYMSQRFSLYDDLTVGQNLAFFGGGYGLAARRLAERVAWVVDMAGLQGDERRLVQELSGGVKQRLALGCAILHEPEILFLDEPTAGVDPLSRRQFWELIGTLATAGVTVFVTTHYMDEAENCHRLGLIYQGRLVASGRPEALKARMQAGVMLELECTDAFAALRLLRGQPALSRVSLFGRSLHVLVEEPATAVPLIQQALRAAGLAVERLETIAFSLEDVFVLLIEQEERHHDPAHA